MFSATDVASQILAAIARAQWRFAAVRNRTLNVQTLTAAKHAAVDPKAIAIIVGTS